MTDDRLHEPGTASGAGWMPRPSSRAADYQDEAGDITGPSSIRRRSGEFWSITARPCTRSSAATSVLNGLNVGIPEGMISIILGRRERQSF